MDKLGVIIARRDLSLAPDKQITVRIGEPQRSADRSSYFCTYEIVGLGDDRPRRAPGGIDSVHALQLVLEKIGIELHVLNEANSGAIHWNGELHGDLGFPLRKAIRDILNK